MMKQMLLLCKLRQLLLCMLRQLLLRQLLLDLFDGARVGSHASEQHEQLIEAPLHLGALFHECCTVLVVGAWLVAAQQQVLPLLDLHLERDLGLELPLVGIASSFGSGLRCLLEELLSS